MTFTIGGMTGVLLAVPPVDYLMHNTTFLIAHFHNMLIPGALFGYFAGYMYWFPKAFGFTLDERWGIRAFWFWLDGFLARLHAALRAGLFGHAAADAALRRGGVAALSDPGRLRRRVLIAHRDRLPDRCSSWSASAQRKTSGSI